MKKSYGTSFLFDRPLKFAKTHKGSNTDFGWKIAKRSALPSEVTRQRWHGQRLTLTCLPIKIGILWSNHAQIRGKIRNQQNVYELRLMPQPLTFMKIMDRILYRVDGVTQVSVLDTTISGVDSGRFGGDELLSLKVFNVLRNRVSAHVNEENNFWWGHADGNDDNSLGTSHDNFVIPNLKSIFGRAKSVVKYQGRRLAWGHKLIINRGGHSEIISSHLWAEEKMLIRIAFANWIFQIIFPFSLWDLI